MLPSSNYPSHVAWHGVGTVPLDVWFHSELGGMLEVFVEVCYRREYAFDKNDIDENDVKNKVAAFAFNQGKAQV